MANPEHLSILEKGTVEWNRWREDNPEVPDLSGAYLYKADLGGVDLTGANLVEVDLSWAVLTGSDFSGANLLKANFVYANLTESNFRMADLSLASLINANMSRVNLSGANLSWADLRMADLRLADLSGANLNHAALSESDLRKVDLTGADLRGADLNVVKMKDTTLKDSVMGYTKLSSIELSSASGIEKVKHEGPSFIGMDTIKLSEGKIPDVFLEGCGLSPWEIELVRLYDPELTSSDIYAALTTNVFLKRSGGPIFTGGVFISFSPDDSDFVHKLRNELQTAGVSVWLDKHDMATKYIDTREIAKVRLKDMVVVVLSESSITSGWVEAKIADAIVAENALDRDVLCPVAVDDSWRKMEGELWQNLKQDKRILDFSAWESAKFRAQFDKMITGMRVYY